MKPQVAQTLEAELADPKHRAPDFDHLRVDRIRGKGLVLATPDGGVPLEKLGKGAFARVFRETVPPGRVFAFTDDDVFDKEIAAFAHDDLPKNPHLPAVEKVGMTEGGLLGNKTAYAMPFYESPLRKTRSPQGWRDYKKLETCNEEVKHGPRNDRTGYDRNVMTNECAEREGVSPAVREALDALTSTAANYSTDYTYEFAPRNLASDVEGNLVLLDVLFDEAKMRQIWREREKARERKEQAGRLRKAWTW